MTQLNLLPNQILTGDEARARIAKLLDILKGKGNKPC